MLEKFQSGLAFYKDLLVRSRAIPAIAAVNILIYVALVISPELAEVFLLAPDQIQERPWTVITVFFSHELHFHLLGNLLIIFLFGLLLEKETGSLHTLLVYFLTGIAGSLAILMVADIGAYDGLIPGASAAALGLLAAIGVLSPNTVVGGRGAEIRNWVIVTFGINVLIIVTEALGATGFGIIGGVGHIAGMIVGVLYGVYLRKYR